MVVFVRLVVFIKQVALLQPWLQISHLLCSRVLNVLPYATSVSEVHCAAVADLSLLTLITGLPYKYGGISPYYV